MMKPFGGNIIFLDRSDINTDEIIPAKYLTEVTKQALAPYLLEDLKLDGFDPKGEALKTAQVIVTRENFGCGSSREHAPWALEVNGINLVIAQGFARIFRQNMFNCGMMALELPAADIDALFALSSQGTVSCDLDLPQRTLAIEVDGKPAQTFSFHIEPFDEALVCAGGWVYYANTHY